MTNLTTCPNCGNRFDAGAVMQKHLEVELKQRLSDQEKQIAAKYEKQLAEEKKQFEQEEKKKMWLLAQAKAQEKADEKNAFLLKALKDENEEKNKQLLAGQKKELEFMKAEQELRNQQEKLKIELEKQVLLKTKEIEENTKKVKDQEFELIKKEYERKLENQIILVNEMKRKAEQGSMQLQGEVQELVIEELLRTTYVFDKIEEVGKGIRGADVIQTVYNEYGQACGKIIFESKRTLNFSVDWIDKLKDDQRTLGAELAVIVTQAMPKDMERFGQKEGIWICNFQEMNSLVFILRKILLSIQSAKTAQENRSDKMNLLYNYMTGEQFKRQLEAIVDGFTNLKSDLEREKRAMQRIWKEREMQIEKVVGNTIDMYGSVKGIAGNAIGSINHLELTDNHADEGA